MSFYNSPSKNSNVGIRPLRGMDRESPGQFIEDTRCITASNMIASNRGLLRRGQFAQTFDDTIDTSTNGRFVDMGLYWDGSGNLQTFIITEKKLFTWTESGGFTGPLTMPRDFVFDENYSIQWDIAQFSDGSTVVVFTDGGGTALQWDGSTVSELYDAASPTKPSVPAGVTFHDRRTWLLRPEGNERARIVWSTVGDPTEYPAANFLTFAGTSNECMKAQSLGRQLAVYFSDAVFVGSRTNISTNPYIFERIDQGAVGLIGPRALTAWADGHFFVGKDDIYYLGGNSSITSIGSAVVRDALEECQFKELITVVPHPEENAILFGFPGSSPNIQKIWVYQYRTREWTYWDTDIEMLASLGTYLAREWDPGDDQMVFDGVAIDRWDDSEGSGTTLNQAGINRWSDWDSAVSARQIFVAVDDRLWKYTAGEGQRDFTTEPITVEYETKDFDFGQPDMEKTINRMTMKIDRVLTQDLNFEVFWSNKRDNAFQSVQNYAGNLTVPAGEDEGRINFTATGSTIRLRLTSMTPIEPYTITEVVYRTRTRGLEV